MRRWLNREYPNLESAIRKSTINRLMTNPAKATLEASKVSAKDRKVTANKTGRHQKRLKLNPNALETKPTAVKAQSTPNTVIPSSPKSQRPSKKVVLYGEP